MRVVIELSTQIAMVQTVITRAKILQDKCAPENKWPVLRLDYLPLHRISESQPFPR